MKREVHMQQRSSETRQAILRAAEATFARHGYDGTGVAEICQAARVSKGAFYHHFPSKHAVFNTLLADWLEGLDQGLRQARREAHTVPEILLGMSAMLRQVFQDAGGRLPIFLEFWAQASRDPQVWQATIAPYQRYQAFFSSLVEQGIAEGSLRPVDPHSAARLIVALATGVLLQGLLDPQGAEWESVAQQGIHDLLQSWRSAE
jgi:AcrR family transcriptional regulator